MPRLALLLLLAATSLPSAGCRSWDRLLRNSPLGSSAGGENARGDRVNLWPLFYRNGASVAVLWPGYDADGKGFALRPLVTHDGTHWELLPPVCYWNTKTGDWVFFPAYSLGENIGLLPIFGSGWLNHAGPVWWDFDSTGELHSGGLFPLLTIGSGFNNVGPIWWSHPAPGAASAMSYGVFPLFQIGSGLSHIGPVLWSNDTDGSRMLLTLLGGKGWDAAGKTTFVNVLGPVFHHSNTADGSSTSVLWPFVNVSDGASYRGWHVWPIVGRGTYLDADRNPREHETTAAAGLFRHTSRAPTGAGETTSLRFLPLLSYRSRDGGAETLADYFTLYGHKEHKGGATGIHVGTPLLFNYRGDARGYRWSTLLGSVQYQSFEDQSEFSLLYYLYRSKTDGTETTRDFFPFCSWDTGVARSGFAFLWRLFRYERVGDRVGGHVFFIPWGDL